MRKFSTNLAESFPTNISINLDEKKNVSLIEETGILTKKVLVLTGVTLRDWSHNSEMTRAWTEFSGAYPTHQLFLIPMLCFQYTFAKSYLNIS